MKWAPVDKATEFARKKRHRVLELDLQRDVEERIQYRMIYGARKDGALSEWELGYLHALIEDNKYWAGTQAVLIARLHRATLVTQIPSCAS